MKKSKWLALAGVSLLSVGVLVACSSKSNTSSNTYNYVYTADPETLDYLISNKGSTTDAVTNGVDGLLENDKYGNLVPSIAKDWTVSADGLTYTYKLRKGVKWYTSDGEEYAEVTAKDFVTGLKHAADKKTESIYLAKDSVVGLADYFNGTDKDFSKVGVKALDDYTLQYTLKQPEPYWNSKMTYSLFWPVNEEFLKSKGDSFGKSTDPSSILYNGPYILKSLTAKSSIELAKNENYWDKKNVHFDGIKLSFYDASDQESLVRNFTDGAYSQARLYPTSSNFNSVEKQYKDNIFYTQPSADIGGVGVNIDRQSYNHTSKKTDAEKDSTKKALLNKDFRQSVNFAIDRTAYSAQLNGEKGAALAVRNLLVKPDFVYAGDKSFGDLVTEKMPSYGDEWSGVNLKDSQDGLFNADKAKTEFNKAKEALQAQGVEFPIHLDLPVEQTNNLLVQQANSFKQSVEEALGKDNVVIDVQQMSTENKNNVTYFAETAAQKDYDINIAGWGPDFQDPSTYLNIFDPDKGDMLQNIGLEKGQNADLADKLGLNEFKKLNEDADSEKQDTTARYTKYAAAQAWLTDSSLVIPIQSNGGSPLVMKAVPFTKPYSLVGIKGDVYVFKYREVQNDIVTAKDYKAAEKKWKKEKEKSNAKTQEELADHVK